MKLGVNWNISRDELELEFSGLAKLALQLPENQTKYFENNHNVS